MSFYEEYAGSAFPSGHNLEKLRDEVQAAVANLDITPACEGASYASSGDLVHIHFAGTGPLQASEKTFLDGLVTAHDPVWSPPKILRYVGESLELSDRMAPIELNYKTGLDRRLHAQRTIVKGEVTKVEWFVDYDSAANPAFTDLILVVDIVYVRDVMGLAVSRTTTRTWKCEDESDASPTKVTTKYYLGNDRTEELERRAKNCLAMQNTIGLGLIITDQMTNYAKTQAEATAIGLGYADEWYRQFENEIHQFKATNSRAFFDAINALTPPTLQWAHDTPGFLTAVADEVNLGNWT